MRVLSDVRDSQRLGKGKKLSSSDFPQTFIVCLTATQSRMTAISNARDLPKEKMTKVRISVQLANLTRLYSPLQWQRSMLVSPSPWELRAIASAAADLLKRRTTDESPR